MAADGPASYYRSVAEGLLFQALAPLLPAEERPQSVDKLLKAGPLAAPGVPIGRQSYPSAPKREHPIGLPIEKDRIRLQVTNPPDNRPQPPYMMRLFLVAGLVHQLAVSW